MGTSGGEATRVGTFSPPRVLPRVIIIATRGGLSPTMSAATASRTDCALPDAPPGETLRGGVTRFE